MNITAKLTTRSGLSWTTNINEQWSDQQIADHYLDNNERICVVEISRDGKYPKQYCSQRFFIEKDQVESALKKATLAYTSVCVRSVWWDGSEQEDIVTIKDDIFVVNGKEFGWQSGDLIDCRYGKAKSVEFFELGNSPFFRHDW